MSGSGNWLTIVDVRAHEERQQIVHSRTSPFLCKSGFMLDMLVL
jgi:hypothetical protein